MSNQTSPSNLTLEDDLDDLGLETTTPDDFGGSMEEKLAAWRERYTKLLRDLATNPEAADALGFNASVYGVLPPPPESAFANFTVDLTAQVRRRDDPGRTVIMILAYTIIICVSLFGNLLVCHVVIRNRRLHTLTNTFLANLAVSDLLMTALNIPFNVARVLLDDWPFGGFMCSVVPFVQATSVYVSAFTMVAIALDRYQVIVHPLKPRLGAFHGAVIIVVVWLLAALVSLPYAIYSEVVEVVTYRKLTRCQARYPHPALEFRQWLTLATFLTQYALPLSITAVAYVGVTRRVWWRAVVGAATKEQLSVQLRAKKKTVKMLLVVVVLFALCWLPLNTYHLVADFGGSLGPFRHSSSVFFLCHWFAMSNVCYNPFIYCWLNDHFRSGARTLLRCVARRVCRLPLSDDDEETPGVSARRPRDSVSWSSSALTGGSVRRKVPSAVRCLPPQSSDVHVALDALLVSPATPHSGSGGGLRRAQRTTNTRGVARQNFLRPNTPTVTMASTVRAGIVGPMVSCTHGGLATGGGASMPRVEVDTAPRLFSFKCPSFPKPFRKVKTIDALDAVANEHEVIPGRKKRMLQNNETNAGRGSHEGGADEVDIVYVEFDRLAQNPRLRPIPEESPKSASPQSLGRHFRSLSDPERKSPPVRSSNARSLFLQSASNNSDSSVQTLHADVPTAGESGETPDEKEQRLPPTSETSNRSTKEKTKTTSFTRNILRNIRDSIAASLARSLPFLRTSQTSSSIQTTETSQDASDLPSAPNVCWAEDEATSLRPFSSSSSTDLSLPTEQKDEFTLPNAILDEGNASRVPAKFPVQDAEVLLPFDDETVAADPAMPIRRPLLDSRDLLAISAAEDGGFSNSQKQSAIVNWSVSPRSLHTHRTDNYDTFECDSPDDSSTQVKEINFQGSLDSISSLQERPNHPEVPSAGEPRPGPAALPRPPFSASSSPGLLPTRRPPVISYLPRLPGDPTASWHSASPSCAPRSPDEASPS